jgi:hypothetical protein
MSTLIPKFDLQNGGVTPTGAVNRPINEKLSETVSVKDFGAVGDGVTDDTTAIQNAISSIPSTGGEIFFPTGTYLFSSTINVNKPILICGTGSGSTNNSNVGSVLKKAASLNGNGIQLSAIGAKIQNITIQGVAGNGGDGIVLIESRCILEDVGVFGMGNDGVRIGTDAAPNNANLWVIRNLKSKNNGRDGLRISSKVRPTLPDANAGTLTMADLQSNGACGLYLGNNQINTFVGLVCQSNGTYGVFSSASSQGNFFYGGDFELNGRGGGSSTSYYDFFIEAGSISNTIFGGSSYNFPQSFLCNEPSNMIAGFKDGSYTGQDKYAGLQIFNIDSSVPTVLDWYKEGTFVPTIVGTTTAGVGTYSSQAGYYTRIGNTVKFHLNLTWSAHTGTGNMRIAGLPFTSSNTGFQPVEIVPSAFTTPANAIVKAMVITNDTEINLYSVLTSGATTLASLAIDTSAACWVSGTYEVA